MNDKAGSLLEQYDKDIIRTWKGRGAILCETQDEILIFKEYIGPINKLTFLNDFLQHIRAQGDLQIESIIRNKEGDLLTYDAYKVPYILKTYSTGRECNYKDSEECEKAVKRLAGLHNMSDMKEYEASDGTALSDVMPVYQVVAEYEKHNKELKKVRKYLRDKGQKTDFEFYLLRHYDYFYDTALQVTEELGYYEDLLAEEEKTVICHGDYQYHNILVTGEDLLYPTLKNASGITRCATCTCL